jgi:hypothetical protein
MDSSERSLKEVLLHSGNRKLSILLAHAVGRNKFRDSTCNQIEGTVSQ